MGVFFCCVALLFSSGCGTGRVLSSILGLRFIQFLNGLSFQISAARRTGLGLCIRASSKGPCQFFQLNSPACPEYAFSKTHACFSKHIGSFLSRFASFYRGTSLSLINDTGLRSRRESASAKHQLSAIQPREASYQRFKMRVHEPPQLSHKNSTNSMVCNISTGILHFPAQVISVCFHLPLQNVAQAFAAMPAVLVLSARALTWCFLCRWSSFFLSIPWSLGISTPVSPQSFCSEELKIQARAFMKDINRGGCHHINGHNFMTIWSTGDSAGICSICAGQTIRYLSFIYR